MIHIYCGNGKGKTTAACGLALRAIGSGMKVLLVQFFKNGNSSEIKAISALENITVMHSEKSFGRYKNMSDDQKNQSVEQYGNMLKKIINDSQNFDMIILDEIISVYGYAMIDRDTLMNFLKTEGENREIVLTGRSPSDELIEIADYVTEMNKIKHPYDKGIKARAGIEF